jgi:biopolymer transport protein ExbD
MGMSAGKKGGGLTEINITPLVDVVLVLLIIFMVVAPLLASNIPIRIPEQVKEEVPVEPQPDNKQIVLQLRKGGDGNVVITLNDVPVAQAELGGQLKTYFAGRRDKIIFFDATDEVPYGPAVEIMDLVRDQGLILGVVPNEITGGQ